MNLYQGPMQPYPSLASWSRQIHLSKGKFSLFFYDTGDVGKAEVLLLHGLGDEADTWRNVLPLIEPDFRVIAPDLPGFGRSDQAKRNYTIPFFVETILDFLNTLSISQIILVGHSTGAVIAQAFARQHPERVKRLILIGGSLVSTQNRLNRDLLLFLIPGLGEWAYTRLRKDPEAAYRSLEPYYNHLSDLPEPERNFLYQRVNERVWSDGQRRGFLSTLRNLASWLPAQQKDLADQFKDWNIPTTVIWGEKDHINPPGNGEALVGMLPSARFMVIPEAGHNVHQEKAPIIAQTIKNGDIEE